MAELTIRLLERIHDVPSEAWDALVGPEDSPFVEHRWLDALEKTGCATPERGWLPRHFAVFRGAELIAAAPAYVKASSEGEFVFDWSWADLGQRMGVPYYPKLVVAVPFTPATGARALVAPGEDRAAMVELFASAMVAWCKEVGVHSIHVNFPRDDEASLWERGGEQAGFLRRAGFQYHWFRRGAATVDDYLARFNSKQRNQIKREMAAPAKQGVSIATLAPPELSREVVRAMYRFYASTVDKHFYGARYLNEKMFAWAAEHFADRLAWVLARDAGGRPIAGAFNIVKGSRLYGRYWGSDVDLPYLHFNVCYYHGVRDCIARGIDVFEPGAGGEHKRARGFVPTTTHSVHWLANARMRAVLEPHLERERERVRQIVAGEADDE